MVSERRRRRINIEIGHDDQLLLAHRRIAVYCLGQRLERQRLAVQFDEIEVCECLIYDFFSELPQIVFSEVGFLAVQDVQRLKAALCEVLLELQPPVFILLFDSHAVTPFCTGGQSRRMYLCFRTERCRNGAKWFRARR